MCKPEIDYYKEICKGSSYQIQMMRSTEGNLISKVCMHLLHQDFRTQGCNDFSAQKCVMCSPTFFIGLTVVPQNISLYLSSYPHIMLSSFIWVHWDLYFSKWSETVVFTWQWPKILFNLKELTKKNNGTSWTVDVTLTDCVFWIFIWFVKRKVQPSASTVYYVIMKTNRQIIYIFLLPAPVSFIKCVSMVCKIILFE